MNFVWMTGRVINSMILLRMNRQESMEQKFYSILRTYEFLNL